MDGGSPPPMPEDVDAANAAFEADAVLVASGDGSGAEDAGGAPPVNGDADAALDPVVTVGAGEDVTAAILGAGGVGGMRLSTPSPSSVPVRVEPETLRLWREEHVKMLEEKDKKEEEQLSELKEQAKKELDDW